MYFQIATIGLAADENPFGVILGGIMYVMPIYPFVYLLELC